MSGVDDSPPVEPVRPRPYRLGQREAAVAQTRARIIAAARDLLAADAGIAGFSVDAVARQAGVSRMTVYYQFDSKRGLLEALFDDLAARGGMQRMADVYQEPEPLVALAELIAVFGGFWATDRVIMRRVRSLAALDPDLEKAVRTRDEWRRNHCRVILGRLAERHDRPPAASFDEAVDILHTLTSFETFDTLAGPMGNLEDVIPIVQRLACTAVGLDYRLFTTETRRHRESS
ncbi:MAG: TetR/AcrR family transcriptional regulator [Dehalococcoidia bacterium]